MIWLMRKRFCEPELPIDERLEEYCSWITLSPDTKALLLLSQVTVLLGMIQSIQSKAETKIK